MKKLKYERPMMFKLDGFDITAGNCKVGTADRGSCKTGNSAGPGMCGVGNYARTNCGTGSFIGQNCFNGVNYVPSAPAFIF